ncbi:PGF-pre-PGF domain-containing protein [Methanococcoides orientis]|uniref:PGF-pre-PGF domain-containing protein n=1 Tax=Methanococcoides orientis TaxID=2822137 RepID=UPI001E31358E|nr:PGF-pre-PGF domain-containing protein [Methanococcoides orientis]UGV41510.1 PGF-pre-PGF domain-containing protein [Methanococcoides orientis]
MNILKKNKMTTKAGLMLFIILMVSIVTFAGTASASTVNASGGADYVTIQDAINESNPGDIIIVEPGIYSENVIITKTLTLEASSTDPSDTIIITNDIDAPVIRGYNVNFTISGFTIEGNGTSFAGFNFENCGIININENIINDTYYYGIYANATDYIYINDNVVSYVNDSDGIDVENTDVAYILNNTIFCIADVGIETLYVNDTYIWNNEIEDTDEEGITVENGNLADVRNNFVNDSIYDSCYINATESVNLINNTFMNSSRCGIVIWNANATQVNLNFIEDVSSDGIYILNINDMHANDNIINMAESAIYVDESGIAEINNNTINTTGYGIYTQCVDFVNITNNYVKDAYYIGIVTEVVNTTNIMDNQVIDPYWGGIAATSIPVYSYDSFSIQGYIPEDIPSHEQSVIENNSVSMTYRPRPQVAALPFMGDNFGIATILLNSSITNNTIMGAGEYTFGGIGNIDMYEFMEPIPTVIEGNTVENVTIGVLSISRGIDVIDNDFNMTRMGVLSFDPYLMGVQSSSILPSIPYEGKVIGNTFDNTRTGMLALFMANTTVQNNIINNGTWNSSGAGVAIAIGFNNTVIDNVISLSPEDESIGVVLFGNENSSIMYNRVDGASIGLKMRFSWNNEMSSNVVSGTDYGILLSDIPYRGFSEIGAYLPGSFTADSIDISAITTDFETTDIQSSVNYDNTIEGNEVKGSTMYGLYLTNSENTTIYNNYFRNINNTMLDDDTNVNTVWNIPKTSGTSIIGTPYIAGNYWAHPDGTGFSIENKDTNSDGIAEKAYMINENNTDFLPLADALDKRSSSGTRAYVGPSQPSEDVESTDSSILRVTGGQRMEYDFGNGPVLGISFDSKEDQGLVVGNVQVLNGAPAEVGRSPEGKQYQIMSITLGPEGTISEETADNIIINFQVTREWINENNIDLSTIRLMRFHDGEWQELPTTMVSDDGEVIHFAAQTPGFSVFSIVGDEAENEKAVVAEDGTNAVAGEPEEASTESIPGFTMLFSTTLLAIAAVVIRRRN